MRINGLSCCGVAEISDLSFTYSTPTDSKGEAIPHAETAEKLWQMCRVNSPAAPQEGFYYRCRWIMFTQAARPNDEGASAISRSQGYGFEFAAFIRDNNLGEVIDSIPAAINPNSSNEVKIWLWVPDMSAVRTWLEAEVARRGYTYQLPAPTFEMTYAAGLADRLEPVEPEVVRAQQAEQSNIMRAFLQRRLGGGVENRAARVFNTYANLNRRSS